MVVVLLGGEGVNAPASVQWQGDQAIFLCHLQLLTPLTVTGSISDS
jgi:hypothetical protein